MSLLISSRLGPLTPPISYVMIGLAGKALLSIGEPTYPLGVEREAFAGQLTKRCTTVLKYGSERYGCFLSETPI